MFDNWNACCQSACSGKLPPRKERMTGNTTLVWIGLAILTAINIYSTVKYARLESAYNELRKVNKILRQRLANSHERPF